jgi:hypothetical protein
VKRFASEYQKTIASATGDSARQTGPSFHAASTNAIDETITKARASARVITPRGSSRIAVRGLSASCEASASRLNPIAALRAATMAATIHPRRWSRDVPVHSPGRCSAINAPVRANGSANTEWLNLTNEAYIFSRFCKVLLGSTGFYLGSARFQRFNRGSINATSMTNQNLVEPCRTS